MLKNMLPLLLASATLACGTPAEPQARTLEGTYALVTVDGAALPAEIAPTYQLRLFVKSGFLVIKTGGAYEYSMLREQLGTTGPGTVYEKGSFATTGNALRLTPATYYVANGVEGGELPHEAAWLANGDVEIVEHGHGNSTKHTFTFRKQ